MSDSRRSFFSSVPGILTGTAGIITAAVAAAGLATQQGWIGDSSDSGTSGGAAGAGGGAGTGGDAEASRPTFSVSPDTLEFEPVGAKEAAVKVTNTGEVSLRVNEPTVTGADAGQFRASAGTCDEAVDPGRSCELNVRFTAKPGTFEATLLVTARGAAKATEVPIEATGLL